MTDTLTDTHAHLYMLEQAPLEEILDRAERAGVRRIVTISTEDTDWEKNRAIASSKERVWYSLGVHPHSAGRWSEMKPALESLFAAGVPPKCVGIGEIGLDFYYDNAPKDAQLVALADQIRMAKRLNLPIIVHCREAFDDFFEIVVDNGPLPRGGVMHCFTGNKAQALRCIELGFYISFSGILTFKKADSLREAAAALPLERLLVETDCPFLSPEPNRGKPNEPAYLPLTVAVLSSVLGIPVTTVTKQTTENAKALFGLS